MIRSPIANALNGARCKASACSGSSAATIGRQTPQTAVINRVFTPPHFRGRGYAGSVTAALVERIFAEGRSAACLYTDLRNPSSNHCYAKIGFTPACSSWHFPRSQAIA
jgi:predicted GNAT family acetyltransferase